jgi:hypothetical protein
VVPGSLALADDRRAGHHRRECHRRRGYGGAGDGLLSVGAGGVDQVNELAP